MLTSDRAFLHFVREERLFCSVLAHLLMEQGENLDRFLRLLNHLLPPDRRLPTGAAERAEVYTEFSYLRDDWFALRRSNPAKRDRILSLFARIKSLAPLHSVELPASISGFNQLLMGERGSRVKRDIVYPGQWTTLALERVAGDFGLGPEGFRDLCRLKWAFNIKPDLVLVLPEARPVCVEAKLESKESSYPTGVEECARFDRIVGPRRRVGQIELQRFMFDVLLDRPCQPVVIARAAIPQHSTAPEFDDPVPFLSWEEIFRALDDSSSIPFVRRLLRENPVLRERTISEISDRASAPA